MKNDSTCSRFHLTPAIISPSHNQRWELLLKNQETIGLQKELRHLESKAMKRSLSTWEDQRLNEVRDLLSVAVHQTEIC